MTKPSLATSSDSNLMNVVNFELIHPHSMHSFNRWGEIFRAHPAPPGIYIYKNTSRDYRASAAKAKGAAPVTPKWPSSAPLPGELLPGEFKR